MVLELIISVLISLGYGALCVQLWLILSTAEEFLASSRFSLYELFIWRVIHVFCIAAYLLVLLRIAIYGLN